jgi:hypothetical protein
MTDVSHFEPTKSPLPLSAFVGQWMITEGNGVEQLIINCDDESRPGWISGAANFTWFPDTGAHGGQQFGVWLQADGIGYRATAQMIAEYDTNYVRRVSPNAVPPIHATVTINSDATQADITLRADDSNGRKWRVQKADLHAPSSLQAERKTWDEFCKWAHDQSKINPGGARIIYRGHKRSSHPLRTAFHRTGRSDLRPYIQNGGPELARRVAAITGRRYVLQDLTQLLELMGIAQHHGYSTPFLDWTESPFIAAYFAFTSNRRRKDEKNIETHVRVLQCNTALIEPTIYPTDLLDPRTMLVKLRPEGLVNSRVVPQQSVLTFANVVDVESLIVMVGRLRGGSPISAIDINLDERANALRDLRAMGITDGSMFPGIDGTCRDLNHYHFGVQDEAN